MKASHTLTKGGLHLGNKRKSRRDLDNDALPTGCGTLGRRQEKADSPALIIGKSPSSFVSLDPVDGGSESGNQLLPVLSLSSCWCSGICVSHAGSGSACFYWYPLAVVLSLHKKGAIPLFEGSQAHDAQSI